MKKPVFIFLFVFIALCMCLTFNDRNFNFPENKIYNYMEDGRTVKKAVNTDNYVAANIASCKILIYDKKSGNSYYLCENVFDADKKNVFLIGSYDDVLLYTAKDADSSGSAVYAFDLIKNKKTEISSYSSVVNENALFGLRELFGITPPANDFSKVLSSRGNMLIYDNKLIYPDGLHKIISMAENSGDFSIPGKAVKSAVNGKKIFFLDNFNRLLMYNGKENFITLLTDIKINNFFIDSSSIYFTSVKEPDKLCCSDYSFSDKIITGTTDTEDIRLYKDRIFIKNSDNSIFYIDENKKLQNTGIKDINNSWCAGDNIIYLYDISSKKIYSAVT